MEAQDGSVAFGHHGISEGADPFYLDRYRIAFLQPDSGVTRHPDTLRCSGQDDRARRQGATGTQECDQCGHIENHVTGIRVLHYLAIEKRPDGQRIGIGDFVRGHQ